MYNIYKKYIYMKYIYMIYNIYYIYTHTHLCCDIRLDHRSVFTYIPYSREE